MNAIDIFKQVGVLIAPISLEKEIPADSLFEPIIQVLSTQDLQSADLSRLKPIEINALSMFVYHGGCGRGSAMAVQNTLWNLVGGRSLEHLVNAINKCGWDEKKVLWDLYPLGYKRNRSQTCLS